MTRSFWLLSALLLAPALASAVEFKPFVSVDARAGTAGVSGQGNSTLLLGQLLAVPALKISDTDSVTLTGLLSSTSSDHVIAEDSFFTQRATALLKPSWRHTLGDGWKSQLRGIALRGANLESPSQPWFTNPYDYEEYSVGAGLSRDGQAFGGKSVLGFGLDVLHRGYPNYRDLTASFTGGKNSASKDYNGLKLLAESRNSLSDDLSGRLALTALLKDYTDCYQVNSDGTVDLSDGKRRNESTLTLSFDMDKGAWAEARVLLNAELQSNLSNQGYFDSGRNVFIPDYYGYTSFSLSPTYHQPLFGKQSGHTVDVGYQFTARAFTGRLARSASGDYLSDKQLDLENALTLDGRYAFAKHFALVSGGALRLVSSNNQYDLGARNSFTLYTLNIGLEYQL